MNGAEVWVYADGRQALLFEMSLRLLAPARKAAEELGGQTRAILIESSEAGVPAEAGANECIARGADVVSILHGPSLSLFRPDVSARALARLVKERRPRLMLFALSELGRELAARTARRVNAGLIADAEEIFFQEGRIWARCPAWGGEARAEIYFSSAEVTGFITFGPHLRREEMRPGRQGTIERLTMEAEEPAGIKRLSCEAEGPGPQKLETAETVVVGGAGVGSREGFELVRELARALAAEVGATRPAVLNHWASEEQLIGQTGIKLRPRLLISVGTSGAVQYTAGITEAELIVAVNRDPNAPIFSLADIGVTADAREFLPALTARVKAASLRRLAEERRCTETGRTPGEGGFGAMIRRMREGRGWSESDLAAAVGHDPEFIQAVEAGENMPSVSFLLRLAKAFEVDPNTFLSGEEKSALAEERSRSFVRRTQNYSYQPLTPGAESQHLRSFLITIEPRQAHKPVAYKHEGEEFIYVLEGELELTVGGRVLQLKPGECHHFNSDIPHKLKSLSDQPTRCLVMLYTP